MFVFFCVFGSCFLMQYLHVLSDFAVVSLWKSEGLSFLCLCKCYHVAVSALCLFLAVKRVGLKCVIVAFPGHTHMLFI